MIHTGLPSPPATRLRSRKLSGETAVAPSSSGHYKGKGKSKQVEFDDIVQTSAAPTGTTAVEDESDLTDLTEVEDRIKQSQNLTTPSPRRLRSNGSKEQHTESSETNRRITPMRKAKGRTGSLKEDETDQEQEEEEDELASEQDVEEDVDELVATPSPLTTPIANKHGRRTPVKKRLRSRRLQTHTPPSDGDDEGSEDAEESVNGEEHANEGDDELSVAEEDAVEEDLTPVSPTPKKLRNGKIVGDEDIEQDIGEEDDDDEDDEDEDDDSELEAVDDASDLDVDADGDSEQGEELDEQMDDDGGER